MHSIKKNRTVSWGLLSDLLLNVSPSFSSYNKVFCPPLVSPAPGAESNSAGGAEVNSTGGQNRILPGGQKRKQGGAEHFFAPCGHKSAPPNFFYAPPQMYFCPC